MTLEYLISKLSAEGYQIGSIKHVHHKGFTMDKEGTNTWRYAKAGSKIIVAISPEEVDVIKKTELELKSLEQILSPIENEKLDLIFIEGFHSLIAKRADVPKIITAKDEADLKRTLEGTVPPILAAAGLIAKSSGKTSFEEIPFIRVPEEGERLVDLVRAELKKKAT